MTTHHPHYARPRSSFTTLSRALLLPLSCFFLASTSTARAAATIDIFPRGNDVMALGYGSVNTTALTNAGIEGAGVGVVPSIGFLDVGNADYTRFSGASGPSSFGGGSSPRTATSGSGDAMGRKQNGDLILPQGYVSGSPLSSTTTWANHSIASLGLTPGQYVYTWGSGGTADSMTINILAASPLVVTTASDVVNSADGLTSLREAIAFANSNAGADTITFGDGSGSGGTNFLDATADTITLAAGQLSLTDTTGATTIQGTGADRLTIDGNNASRILLVNGNVTAEVADLTLARGNASGNGGNGGAILCLNGNVTLRRCVVRDSLASFGGGVLLQNGILRVIECSVVNNESSIGGGIYVSANFGSPRLFVSQSSIVGNRATSSFFGGGGIFAAGTVSTITNCVIAGNTSSNTDANYPLGGAGLYILAAGSQVTTQNTLLVGNSSPSGSPDFAVVSGITPTDKGGNLVGIPGGFTLGQILQVDGTGKPLLANNGGPTPTVALVAGSPAIDTGVNLTTVDVAGVDASATTIPVLDSGAFISGLTLQIEGEQMVVQTAPTATSITVTRGANGTTAAAHSAGAAVSYAADQRGQPRSFGLGVDIGAVESAPPIVFVNASVSGGNGSGDSWTNAIPELRTAIALAQGSPTVTQIWVASGIYKPAAPNGSRSATFRLRNGLALYGGFTGTETLVTQRNSNPATNGTVLSGDLNGDDSGFTNNGENSLHVVTGSGTAVTAVLDGFTVTAGNANAGGFPNGLGGGMINQNGNATLTNLTFSGNSANSGGGIYNDNSGSPTLTNVTFSGNSATSGGGLHNISSNLTLTNATFSGNSADFGGGLYNISCSPALTNVAFSGNSATRGGGIYNVGSNPALTNVTISGNSASSGGAIYNNNSSPTLRNCILWGNSGGEIIQSVSTTTVSDSIVQGGYAGTNVVDSDPLFVTPITVAAPTTAGNLRLRPGSPAIDTGSNGVVTATTDLDGNPRIVATNVDMGAYESGLVPITPTPGRYIGSGSDALGALNYNALGFSSGYITIGGLRFSFFTKFNGTTKTVNAKRTGFAPIAVTITARTGDGLHAQLRLSYTDPVTNLPVDVDISRTAYDLTNPCPHAGNWKVAFRNSSAVGAPTVSVLATVSITSTGTVRMAGSTVNRRVFTRGTVMVNPASIPYFMSCILAPTQTLQGTLEFAGNRVTGTLHWEVPAGSDPAFTSAVSEDYDAIGSRVAALPTSAQTGTLTLTNPSFTAGPVTGAAALQPTGLVTGIPRVFVLVFSTGGVSGTYVAAGVLTRLSGVYLPADGEIIGFTRQGNNFGEVTFTTGR